MRELNAIEITKAVKELCLTACCELPQEVVFALSAGEARESEGSAAKSVLSQLLENQCMAQESMRPICQDTGMAVVFLDIGQDLHIIGDVYAAVDEGVREAYVGSYLRKSVLSPVTRINTNDNTPAVVHIRLTPGDKLHIAVAPKGFGSENMSKVHMLPPAAGVEGILNAIVDTVKSAGACACPPVVVGVGIGGTMEQAALLAKRQLLRPLGQPTDDPEVKEIEAEALRRINLLGIGPMGLGGKTTALAVHAMSTPTHIAGLPVAVNMQCHACRHGERTL